MDDAAARGDTTVAVPLVLAMVAAGCAQKRRASSPRAGRRRPVAQGESAREIAMKESRNGASSDDIVPRRRQWATQST